MNLGRKFASVLGAMWLLAMAAFRRGVAGHPAAANLVRPPSRLAISPPARDGGAANSASRAGPDVNVLTYHHNNARTGEYLSETLLTPANVNSRAFGKIGFLRVRGLVDAQPLYVANLVFKGAAHRVVFVATEHDLVYAFDADTFSPLWRTSVLGAGETTSDNRGCQQVTPEIGVTSTPVIDLKSRAQWRDLRRGDVERRTGRYFQRLHALDLTTGSELPGSPRTITGDLSRNGLRQQERPELHSIRNSMKTALPCCFRTDVIYTTVVFALRHASLTAAG